jgi:hypothetical protein
MLELCGASRTARSLSMEVQVEVPAILRAVNLESRRVKAFYCDERLYAKGYAPRSYKSWALRRS